MGACVGIHVCLCVRVSICLLVRACVCSYIYPSSILYRITQNFRGSMANCYFVMKHSCCSGPVRIVLVIEIIIVDMKFLLRNKNP